MAAIYRGMDRATLDAAYDNTGQVADSQDYRARWLQTSDAGPRQAGIAARSALSASGRAPRSTIFPAKPGAPLFVFIHGGYWQRNEKERFSFTALGPNAHGINVAVPGYTLAPDARLTDIVAEMRQALSFSGRARGRTWASIPNGCWSAAGRPEGISPPRWPIIRRSRADCRSAAFSISSRSRSACSTTELQLSADEVATLSPLNNLPARSPPLELFAGGAELPELKRQSQAYAAAAQGRGLPVNLTMLPGHHHFSILDELQSPDGALTKAIAQMVARLG